MKDKKGFIATSILYAFLLCFLTLFLAYMANYIQNKMLIDRVGDLAKEDLSKYNNTYVTDLSLGDYVIFDTIDPEGADTVSGVKVYDSPISPDARWILFKIEGGDLIDKESGKYEPSLYYFVSDSTAQKYQPLVNSLALDASGAYAPIVDNTNLSTNTYSPNLKNIERVLNGHIYYSSRKYWSSEAGDLTAKSAYKYAFPYTAGGGITEIRYLNDQDLNEIFSLKESITDAIMDQGEKFVFWNTGTYFNSERKGFLVYKKEYLEYLGPTDSNSGTNPSEVNRICHSSGASSKDGLMDFSNNNANDLSYGHLYSGIIGQNYIDYCYYVTSDTLGDCQENNAYACRSTNGEYPPRFVVVLTVNKGNLVMNGRADSGNGTIKLPYLFTTGA